MKKLQALLVEDDWNKRDQLAAFMSDAYAHVELIVASSLIGAIKKVKASPPEVVLLDMTLPNFDPEPGDSGEGMHAYGGEEFLRQVERFELVTKVIVVTQWETFGASSNEKSLAKLDEELKAQFPQTYIGSIYYHATLNNWMAQLQLVLDPILGNGDEASEYSNR